MGADGLILCAEAKGLPASVASVYTSDGLFAFSGLLTVVSASPVVAAGALATFLPGPDVTRHGVWAVPEDRQQDERTQYPKNGTLAGGAVPLLAVAGTAWPYSVGLGAFYSGRQFQTLRVPISC